MDRFIRIIFAALLLAMMCAAASAENARNITQACTVTVNQGKTKNLTDQKIASAWKPAIMPALITVDLPDAGAQGIRIDWVYAADDMTLIELDADGEVIRTTEAQDAGFDFYSQFYRLLPETRTVQTAFYQEKQQVAEIYVYSEGDLPITVQEWQAPYEKCDLMVIAAHQDDEWLWFGGMIPYYQTVRNKRVQVVYMCLGKRSRAIEALNANAVAGNDVAPVFMEFKDEKAGLNKVYRDWGGYRDAVREMAALIRRSRPDVILTHDWDGEYGHPEHIALSRMMQDIIDTAADESEEIDNLPAWQVKKLYRHLEEKDEIVFDWDQVSEAFDGQSLSSVVNQAFLQNRSQLGRWTMAKSKIYDNTRFGLSWSCVGRDALHEDLFENVDAE